MELTENPEEKQRGAEPRRGSQKERFKCLAKVRNERDLSIVPHRVHLSLFIRTPTLNSAEPVQMCLSLSYQAVTTTNTAVRKWDGVHFRKGLLNTLLDCRNYWACAGNIFLGSTKCDTYRVLGMVVRCLRARKEWGDESKRTRMYVVGVSHDNVNTTVIE